MPQPLGALNLQDAFTIEIGNPVGFQGRGDPMQVHEGSLPFNCPELPK